MLFRKMTEADKPLIDGYLARTDYPGSDYSMLYLSGWDFFNFEESMQIAESGGALYIRFVPNLAKEICAHAFHAGIRGAERTGVF